MASLGQELRLRQQCRLDPQPRGGPEQHQALDQLRPFEGELERDGTTERVSRHGRRLLHPRGGPGRQLLHAWKRRLAVAMAGEGGRHRVGEGPQLQVPDLGAAAGSV
jgi:hypothetical protein